MSDIQITIDPEFQGKIPPLTEAEYKQLEENIVSDGEIYEPIVTWNNVIVDGHNRWKIHTAHPEIPFRTKEMAFADKWAAFDWMYRKQLGRRNLTDEQRTCLLGKLYESRKKSDWMHKNRYSGNVECAQNGNILKSEKSTRISEEIAKDLGVSKNTVIRAEHFSKGIDAIQSVSQETAQKILEHKIKIPKSHVAEVRNMDKEQVRQFAESVLRGEQPAKPSQKKKEVNNNPRETNQQETGKQNSQQKSNHMHDLIGKVYNDMVTGANQRVYTVDDLVSNIELNADEYVGQLRQTLAIRSTVLTTPEIRERVRATIKSIQNKIQKVSELL